MTKICNVVDCGPAKKLLKGMCTKHYQRVLKHGNPYGLGVSGINGDMSIEERFWAKVDKSEENRCWVWTGYLNKGGYGSFRSSKASMELAHRYSYKLANNEIPQGMFIDHICHNRACVNPEHLRTATRGQNQENLQGARSNSKSGFRGVIWSRQSRKWKVYVVQNGKSYHGGYFHDIVLANESAIALRNRLFTHNDVDRK